jgi:hypothetical protein
MGREAARDVGRTRVPADMIGQQIRLEAKGTEPFGDPIGRVIADQHCAADTVRIDCLDRRRFFGPKYRHCLCGCFGIHHRGPV